MHSIGTCRELGSLCVGLLNKDGLHLDSLFIGRSLNPRLGHQVIDALLQIINPIAHVVYPADYLVGHRLELVLHVLQEVLHLQVQASVD